MNLPIKPFLCPAGATVTLPTFTPDLKKQIRLLGLSIPPDVTERFIVKEIKFDSCVIITAKNISREDFCFSCDFEVLL